MVIRAVQIGDVPSLRANCFSALDLNQTRENVETALELIAAGEGTSLVAVDEGRIVANLTVTRKHHRLERHRAEVGGFVVAPSARGSGLARQLVDGAEAWARGCGCTILELSCRGGTHAEDAYIHLGFREWGRLPHGYREPGGEFDQVNLYRPIPAV